MSTLLALGLLVGLDNLRVGIGLGALDLSPRRRRQMALAFGLFEALMPLAGALMGAWLASGLEAYLGWVGPALLGLCALVVLWGGRRQVDVKGALSGSAWLFAFPFALSIDNLLAGSAAAASGIPLGLALPLIGILSASLSLAGLYGGAALVRRLPLKRGATAAGTLMLMALASWFILP